MKKHTGQTGATAVVRWARQACNLPDCSANAGGGRDMASTTPKVTCFLFLSSLIWAEGISQPVHLGILTEPGLKRSFTLVQVPPLPRRWVEKACRASKLAHLNSRAMQLHLVTEANRTEYSHVTAWVDLDRALTRHDSLVYINGSELTDDVTDSNSTELLCVSVSIRNGGGITYQAEACSERHAYVCNNVNGSLTVVPSPAVTWFKARYQCREQHSSDLAYLSSRHRPLLAATSGEDTYWIAPASVDSMTAYRTWQPVQDTPKYECVLFNLTTGHWTAVNCIQTNGFVLCEVVTNIGVTNQSTTQSVSTTTSDVSVTIVTQSDTGFSRVMFYETQTGIIIIGVMVGVALVVIATTISIAICVYKKWARCCIPSSSSVTRPVPDAASTISDTLPQPRDYQSVSGYQIPRVQRVISNYQDEENKRAGYTGLNYGNYSKFIQPTLPLPVKIGDSVAHQSGNDNVTFTESSQHGYVNVP